MMWILMIPSLYTLVGTLTYAMMIYYDKSMGVKHSRFDLDTIMFLSAVWFFVPFLWAIMQLEYRLSDSNDSHVKNCIYKFIIKIRELLDA